MKKLFILFLAVSTCTALSAQKNKNKNNSGNAKEEAREVILGKPKTGSGTNTPTSSKAGDHDEPTATDENEGHKGGGPKFSKNQPAKVREAFARDYPSAANVSWSKYRGDWTATFRNGLTTSTAVYHANGQRKDTRTVIGRPQLPKVILDDILKKRPGVQLGEIIKIELPQGVKDIFRVSTIKVGTTHISFYDASGAEVKYDY